MKLTSKRFLAEDFQGQSEWISPLLSSLNQLMQELQAINNSGITIAENLNQELIETKFKLDSATYPIVVKTKLNTTPKGLQVVYCQATDGSTASEMPWVTYSFANNLLTITAITGLTSGKTYNLRLHIIYS